MAEILSEKEDVNTYITDVPENQEQEIDDLKDSYQNGQYTDEEDVTADQKMLEQLEENASILDAADGRSVFVGNVDYGATPSELQEHFKNCGHINRITIMIDRYTGHPKGYAYIEFQDEESINHAVALDQSTFRDRQLKVLPKRKNMPGYSMQKRGFSGRGGFVPRGRKFSFSYTRGRGFRGGISPYYSRYRKRGQPHVVQPY